jgi:hypothetical protein
VADHNQLKHYWTKDPEGLAKWVDHPHPWTALYHHLLKHMPAEMAKRVASQWFHDVFGIWPGEREGKNPLGPRGASMSHPHMPAGSPDGGQFAPTSGSKQKTKPHAHPHHHHDDGTLSFDAHANHGTGYDQAGGDARVHDLQAALNRLGLTDGDGRKLKLDGKLGPRTTAAVKAAQKRLGVAQDGKVTPALLKQLVAAKSLPASRGDAMDLSVRAVLTRELERRIYPAQFEVRATPDGTGGTKYSLRGYATVYERGYDMFDQHGEYRETVRAGAGKKTLSENPDVVLRMDHTGIPLARTKNRSLLLSEDSTGLDAYAPQLNGSRSDIRNVVTAVEDGILDEMSFAFRCVRQQWSDDYTQRDIAEYNLNRGDVSVVTFGANPNTSVSLRAQDLDVMDEDAARVLYERLDRRFNPPKPQRSIALIKALAEVQG